MDERDRVVQALRGRSTAALDPLGGLGDRMAAEALPVGLGIEAGTRRLLNALKRENPGIHRRLLVEAASENGLYVSSEDPKARKTVDRVEEVLADATRVTERLQDWVSRMETRGHAVVIRRDDPGAKDPKGRCTSCGVPAVLGAALGKTETTNAAWTLVLVR